MVRAHCAIEERIPVEWLTEKLLAHRVVHRCVPFDFYEHSGYFLFFDIRRMVPIGCTPPCFICMILKSAHCQLGCRPDSVKRLTLVGAEGETQSLPDEIPFYNPESLCLHAGVGYCHPVPFF